MSQNNPSKEERTKKLFLLRLSDVFLLPIVIVILVILLLSKDTEEESPLQPVENILSLSAKALILDYYVPSFKERGVLKPTMEMKLSSGVDGWVYYVSSKFKVGETLEKGHVIAKVDSTEYEANLAEANIRLLEAKLKVEECELNTQLAQEEWNIMRGEGRATPEFLQISQLELAKTRYQALEVLVKQAEFNLQKCEIVAPYSCKVKKCNISEGQRIDTSSLLGEVYSHNKWYIECDILESQIKKLGGEELFRCADIQTCCIESLPLNIRSLSDYLEGAKRTIKVFLESKEAKELESFNFGSSVEVKFEGKLAHSKALNLKALKVEKESLYQNYLVGVSQEETLSLTPVEIIKRKGGNIFVKSKVGSYPPFIVTTPVHLPIEGTRVNIKMEEESP